MERRLKFYDKTSERIITGLVSYDKAYVEAILYESRNAFENLIPRIPDIGEKNIWKINLTAAAIYLSIYKTLQKYNYTLKESIVILDILTKAYINSFSFLSFCLAKKVFFSKAYIKRCKKSFLSDNFKSNRAGWTADFIEGDGTKYDFGYDVKECAILKFYRKENAEELMQYICSLDYVTADALKINFFREGTLAGGFDKCDCRYKKGKLIRA